MIRIFTLILICGICLNAISQTKTEGLNIQSKAAISAPFTVIKSYQNKARSQGKVHQALHYNFDLRSIENEIRDSRRSLELIIPTLDGDKRVILERIKVLSQEYELSTENGRVETEAFSYKFYKGKVEDAAGSKVGMSILGKKVHLMIFDQDGTFQISRVNDQDNVYTGFYAEDELNPPQIDCQVDEIIQEKISQSDNTSYREGPLECVDVYLEIDYKSYTENGSTIVSVEAWALALLAQVAIFYDDAGIPIAVSAIKIYTSQDPYTTHSNSSQMLYAFRDSMNSQGFNGRLAHLLSGRGIGGGIAYINVLCNNSNNVAVSGNLNSGQTTYTSYVWNIMVIAHEMGHNFGANHTHACVWDTDNDPNTPNAQIDDCGNVYAVNKGNTPGSCYDPNNPILPGNTATIMSYCHLVSGASINLNYGFHPIVRERILSRFDGTNCGGGETCTGIPPGNDLCADAIRLIPTYECNALEYDNLYATSPGSSLAISCGSANNEKDVWFVTKVPADGVLHIETLQLPAGLTDMIIQIYSGTCGSLLVESCNDNSGINNHAAVDINDIGLANTDILVRVIETSGAEGIFGICVNSATLPCSEVVDSLISFYSELGGANWSNKSGWEDGVNGLACNYCNWYGITCDVSENIIGISLSNNNLIGTFNNSLDQMNYLEELDLATNSISGSIPDIWNSLPELRILKLSSNALSGSLPISVDNLSKLEVFEAQENSIGGIIPNGIGYLSFLDTLNLSNNVLEGCYSWSVKQFCENPKIDFSGNAGLPSGGDLTLFCSDNYGLDSDLDGHCLQINDCNDNNASIYNGAPELCDGLDNNCDTEIDEGMNHGPNIWMGPETGGAWNNPNYWGLGHVPLGCEDVELGMEGSSIVIDQSGQGNSVYPTLRSLCIGPNSNVNLGDYSNLFIKEGYVLNQGTFEINGYYSFTSLDASKNGIENSGILNIGSNSYIVIKDSGINGVYNKIGGQINNDGNLNIDSNDAINGNSGLKNEGVIDNTGTINIIGTFKVSELELKLGSILNNSGSRFKLNVGGSSIGGEGN